MTPPPPPELLSFQASPERDPDGSLLRATLAAHERCVQARGQRLFLVHLLALFSIALWAAARWPGALALHSLSVILSCWAGLFLALLLVVAREWVCYRERARFLDMSRAPPGAEH